MEMEDKEEINNDKDYINTIESAMKAFKEHGVQSTNIWVATPYRKTKQDRIDWLFLIHNEEYDNHPLVRIIDTLIIISGCFIDFLSNIGNRFIEHKIEKKYVVKRKHRNKLSKKELRKLALGRIQGFGWRMAKRK